MQKAFNWIQKEGLKARWINKEMLKSSILKLPYTEIMIVTHFIDDEVRNSLRNNCHIISPLVITYCDDEICRRPQYSIVCASSFICSQCLRDIEVTTTDIPMDQCRIIKFFVKKMSGVYYDYFRSTTSVVVSGSAMTHIARIAAKNHIPIVREEWIKSCWSKYQHEHRYGNEEEIISKYRLPIIDNRIDDDTPATMNIKRAKINEEKKTAVFMFSKFGDYYLKTNFQEMAQDVLNIIVKDDRILTKDVTHLILNRPRPTEKVFWAIAAGAYILKPEYIYESIKSKKLLPEENYQWGLDSNVPSTSTSSSGDQSQINEYQLLKVAMEWKQEIDKNNRKPFQDMKMLLLDPMQGDSYLKKIANILRAGGADVMTIEEISNESRESIHFALLIIFIRMVV
ncbi:uncharacterized protein LOC142597592 [Dermatophagoides farinae]|uniref:uncharacterized protein LOC142597592 n=1 Tax=Dermatophagoides farinae TaxID=6954 RepID=UPI003F62327A